MDYIELNQKVWDKNAEDNHIWSLPVSPDDIRRAKNGDWHIVLTPIKAVPRTWFPKDLQKKLFYVWLQVVGNRDRY